MKAKFFTRSVTLLLFWFVISANAECESSGVDSIPLLSQGKSLFQWLVGDSDGAKCTQENFSKGAPGISQLRSAVEAANGDHNAAKKTQMYFLKNMESNIDETPILGHIKGAIHLDLGDNERGKQIMKDASRSVAVIGGAFIGGLAGAVAAGAGYDAIVTGIDSAVSGEYKPYGMVDTISNAGQVSAGGAFDFGAGLVFDAYTGKTIRRGQREKTDNDESENQRFGSSNDDRMDIDDPMDIDSPTRTNNNSPRQSLSAEINDANLNSRLKRKESWENAFINDPNLMDNCYYCSLAALKRRTVNQLMNDIEVMQERGGASLNQILDVFKEAGYEHVRYQEFSNRIELHNFLNDIIDPGTNQVFGLAYHPSQNTGHMIVLKAWKTVDGTLEYRLIDFQLDPNDPSRFRENVLPNGVSYLFELHELNPESQYSNNPNIFFGAKSNGKKQWIDLTALAKAGGIQSIPTRTSMKWCSSIEGTNNMNIWCKNNCDNGNCPNNLCICKSKSNSLPKITVSDKFIMNPNTRVSNKLNTGTDHLIAKHLAPAHFCGKKIIGYYTSWGTHYFSAFHAQRLTHVIFAFMNMKEDGSILDDLRSNNPNEDPKRPLQRLEYLLNLAKHFPHLKVMFAVGGWENSQYFSSMAASYASRGKFINSIIQMIEKWGFDGVDIDWEYPVIGGANKGTSNDKQNYVLLMKEIRNALDTKALAVGRTERYLLSFASAAGKWTLDPGYDLQSLLNYADWVNVMTYDYFGAWESQWGAFTGPPAPLYFGAPKKYSGKLNVDWTLKYYVCRTKNPEKIVIGVPFYGRFWKNVGNPINESDGMWRLSLALNGKVEGGFESFRDIQKKWLLDGSYEQNFHETTKTPYLWNPSQKIFMGYENKLSLQYKVDYAVSKNLGGIMIWAVDLDDESLSLLNTVFKAPLCTGKNDVNFKCSPVTEKRWWTWDESMEKAGMCGKSAPLYKGFYPVCDPEDPGYSCCGAYGFCGSGDEFCNCSTCVDYGNHPEKILEEPVKPTVPIQWYFNNAANGQRGRCGRSILKLNGQYPICNPDDPNAHCCSNGFYCGTGSEFCECDGCIDFKRNPWYRFKEKRWWEWADGIDKSGRCGLSAPKINGQIAECDPDSKWPCCGKWGYCGDSDEFCNCPECVDYRS